MDTCSPVRIFCHLSFPRGHEFQQLHDNNDRGAQLLVSALIAALLSRLTDKTGTHTWNSGRVLFSLVLCELLQLRQQIEVLYPDDDNGSQQDLFLRMVKYWVLVRLCVAADWTERR